MFIAVLVLARVANGRSDVDMFFPISSSTEFRTVGNSGYLGWTVTGVGDINSDGIDDIAMGAYLAEGAAGRVVVIYGHNSTTSFANIDAAKYNYGAGSSYGSASNTYAATVARAGDVNGDGIADMIIVLTTRTQAVASAAMVLVPRM